MNGSEGLLLSSSCVVKHTIQFSFHVNQITFFTKIFLFRLIIVYTYVPFNIINLRFLVHDMPNAVRRSADSASGQQYHKSDTIVSSVDLFVVHVVGLSRKTQYY